MKLTRNQQEALVISYIIELILLVAPAFCTHVLPNILGIIEGVSVLVIALAVNIINLIVYHTAKAAKYFLIPFVVSDIIELLIIGIGFVYYL